MAYERVHVAVDDLARAWEVQGRPPAGVVLGSEDAADLMGEPCGYRGCDHDGKVNAVFGLPVLVVDRPRRIDVHAGPHWRETGQDRG